MDETKKKKKHKLEDSRKKRKMEKYQKRSKRLTEILFCYATAVSTAVTTFPRRFIPERTRHFQPYAATVFLSKANVVAKQIAE